MKPNTLLYFFLFLTVLIILAFKKVDKQIPIVHTSSTKISKTNLLTAHVWEVKETIQNLSCNNVHYIKDSINETGYEQNLLRISFNDDGTGNYTDHKGLDYKLYWKFISSDSTNMNINITGLLSHDWNMVSITEDCLMETTKIPGIGLVTAKWGPVNKNCDAIVSSN